MPPLQVAFFIFISDFKTEKCNISIQFKSKWCFRTHSPITHYQDSRILLNIHAHFVQGLVLDLGARTACVVKFHIIINGLEQLTLCAIFLSIQFLSLGCNKFLEQCLMHRISYERCIHSTIFPQHKAFAVKGR